MTLTIKGSAFFFGVAAEAVSVSFDNYFTWLKSVGSEAFWPYLPREEDPEVRRSLYCDLDSRHFFGVFLSARNAEFQHFVKREGDRVIVEARSTAGNPPVEMNFFCLRRDSNKGIFSHYLGSYRFQRFLYDLWMTYREFVKNQKLTHLSHLMEGESETEVAKSYSLHNRNQNSPLYTPGTFNELIDKLVSVSEVRATTYTVDGPADEPVRGSLKSVHKVYRLEEVRTGSRIKRWINNVRESSSHGLKSGRTVHSGSVIGKDENGSPLAISFENTMDDYLEYEYDALGTFEVNRIKRHTLVRAMLDQLDQGLLFSPTERDS